jgi:NAD(P)-dependent dehydrogenase (short-subunit alcohol dehydrogenase family)
MTDARVWFITRAGRGMGVDIAQAALAAGYRVVATARDAARGTGCDVVNRIWPTFAAVR